MACMRTMSILRRLPSCLSWSCLGSNNSSNLLVGPADAAQLTGSASAIGLTSSSSFIRLSRLAVLFDLVIRLTHLLARFAALSNVSAELAAFLLRSASSAAAQMSKRVARVSEALEAPLSDTDEQDGAEVDAGEGSLSIG